MKEINYHIAQLFMVADEHYGRGGDVVIECWNSDDLRQLLEQCGSYQAAEDLLKSLMGVWHDRRQNVENNRG